MQSASADKPTAALSRDVRLDGLPTASRLRVGPASSEELPSLANLLKDCIPDLKASFSSFKIVHEHTGGIFSINKEQSLVGCFAFLFLNPLGVEKLLDGSLSMTEPQVAGLACMGDRVEAIYIWALAVRPPINGIRVMSSFVPWLQRPEFAHAEIYGRPTTDKGLGFARNLGLRPVSGRAKDRSLWATARFA